jgi:predicted PurR-regulated permease PerM
MSSLRNLFWVLSLGVIGAYLFFFALGGFRFDEVLPLTIAVAVLIVLWTIHAWLQKRHDDGKLDPVLMQARERRGF